MGSKLLWLGLTIIMTQGIMGFIPISPIVGQVLMVIGILLFLFGK